MRNEWRGGRPFAGRRGTGSDDRPSERERDNRRPSLPRPATPSPALSLPSSPPQYPLLVPADGSTPLTDPASILAALGAPAPADAASADQWMKLAAALAPPVAALVEPIAGERPAKDGEAVAAIAELKR